MYGAILCSKEWFEKKFIFVSLLVGFRNMSGSILDGFRLRSRFKKFICPLASCVGFNLISICIWFVLVVIVMETENAVKLLDAKILHKYSILATKSKTNPKFKKYLQYFT